MTTLSKNAQAIIAGWVKNLQDGDCIKMKGRTAYFYNSAGCEIDRAQ